MVAATVPSALSELITSTSLFVQTLSSKREQSVDRACAEAGKRLCYMNIASDEVIRSLFFNKHNQNLITVSVYSGDNYTSLRCRTTPLECAYPGPVSALNAHI